MDLVGWVAVGLFLAVVIVVRFFSRRSEDHNRYIDEVHQREPRDPPASGGYFG